MTLFVAFEILGTIAFAVSGAVVAISKKMDIFGVAILGMTTAVGGGILRDLILGITPPAAFQSPGYALTSVSYTHLDVYKRQAAPCVLAIGGIPPDSFGFFKKQTRCHYEPARIRRADS